MWFFGGNKGCDQEITEDKPERVVVREHKKKDLITVEEYTDYLFSGLNQTHGQKEVEYNWKEKEDGWIIYYDVVDVVPEYRYRPPHAIGFGHRFEGNEQLEKYNKVEYVGYAGGSYKTEEVYRVNEAYIAVLEEEKTGESEFEIEYFEYEVEEEDSV